MPRQINKTIEIEERELLTHYGDINSENSPEPGYKVISSRKFIVKKPNSFDGFILAKTLAAKLLPMFQSFVPLIGEAKKSGATAEAVLENLGNYLSLDSIASALDKLSPADAKYVMRMSLRNVYEVLPAGEAQVYKSDGTFGVLDVEYDFILTMRLVCEFILWACGDFFDVSRLGSIMSPLSSSLRQQQRT
jgi:hypothetical protein